MLYKQDALGVAVEEMKTLGEHLVPWNSPENEPDLSVLKARQAVVDGYELCLYYTKSRFDDHCTEILQVWGNDSPFLPFNVVCKVARAFLGQSHLSLVELFKGNRKVYCWSLCVDHTGRPMPSPYQVEVEDCSFEGFKYSYMQPNQVNLY